MNRGGWEDDTVPGIMTLPVLQAAKRVAKGTLYTLAIMAAKIGPGAKWSEGDSAIVHVILTRMP